ncbi:hypothetical protein [Paenarthrobacter sp. PH39-S1]|uniref:hypothetical protein n=1 Tax=Paenarthrobacter sp. PH39-S1 TaxID=3046204 RepID=UPI0024BBC198|nr:hypothetical protein [Paenarthrobacter sp. PH39-S1]
MSSTASVSQPVDAAVQSCGVKSATGISIMDTGKSLEIQTAGKGKSGLAISDMGCVLRELKTPQSVIAKMDSTRALDGTQSGTWGNFPATWRYHPDNGFNVVIETVAK